MNIHSLTSTSAVSHDARSKWQIGSMLRKNSAKEFLCRVNCTNISAVKGRRERKNKLFVVTGFMLHILLASEKSGYSNTCSSGAQHFTSLVLIITSLDELCSFSLSFCFDPNSWRIERFGCIHEVIECGECVHVKKFMKFMNFVAKLRFLPELSAWTSRTNILAVEVFIRNSFLCRVLAIVQK